MLNRMSAARKKLEHFANSSFDKSLATSVYLIASESLQCENEIRSHIDSLNCSSYEELPAEDEGKRSLTSTSNLDNVCDFLEDNYLHSYKRLLDDKKFGSSIRNLIKNHFRMFNSSVTQLRLFNDVKYVAN
ncbi:MAG: hypothetical protein JST21_16915 [Bacteroidetes bacterium]|nr:hypothetical protein [Bacteroidota bacterium]